MELYTTPTYYLINDLVNLSTVPNVHGVRTDAKLELLLPVLTVDKEHRQERTQN